MTGHRLQYQAISADIGGGRLKKNNLLDDLQKYGDNPDTDDHDFLNTWIAKGKADTGPSEAMLFKARQAVVASGGDLHDVDDFELETDIKKLREEVAQPDSTAASFADRVGPSQ